MGSDAIGVIELVGLTAAVTCADAAVKAADIKFLGYELSKGGGMVTIKLSGSVGAIQAAVAAGTAAAALVGEVVGKLIIPRPHQDLDQLIMSPETVKAVDPGLTLPEENIVPDTWAEEEIDDGDSPVPGEEDFPISSSADDDQEGDQEEAPYRENEEEIPGKISCNICGDPSCPRQKGEPHALCLHFKDGKR